MTKRDFDIIDAMVNALSEERYKKYEATVQMSKCSQCNDGLDGFTNAFSMGLDISRYETSILTLLALKAKLQQDGDKEESQE